MSQGRFVTRKQAPIEKIPAGWMSWHSGPRITKAKDIVVVEAHFAPGKSHSFHIHSYQEEVIYVISGKIEQWIKNKKRILKPGDSVFIPRKTVHATFNDFKQTAVILAILSPRSGKRGIQLVDVCHKAPWNTMR